MTIREDFWLLLCSLCQKEVAICSSCYQRYWSEPQMTIREDFRLFPCPLCQESVAICSSCYRGQRYCPETCSEQARRQSVREAGRRYQQTPDGKAKHAARQAVYQLRQSSCGHSEEGSSQARQPSMGETGQQYQQTPHEPAKHAMRQMAYQLRQSSFGHFSEKDDASGYPNADRLMHTLGEDAEDDLGDALSQRKPLRCCLCGAWCVGVRALRRHR